MGARRGNSKARYPDSRHLLVPLDMTQQNIPELAKQGNPSAIAALLNRSLQPQGITAKAILKEDCLHLLLEGAQIPEQHVAMPILYEELTNLGIETIPSLLVYGRQKGVKEPAWSETIDLAALYPSEDEFVPMTGGAYASYEDDYAENSEGEYASEGVYSDEDAPVVASSGKKPRSLNVDPAQLKKLLPLLAIPIVLLLGLGVWWFLNRSPEPAVAPAIAPTAPPGDAPATAPGTQPAAADPWREAVNRATRAAELTQTATTRAEWNTVASLWQEAIDFMRAVPQTSPNYETAQQRAVAYQSNLEYAQRAAATRPQ